MIPCNSRHAPPKAAAMIEALRGLGYTTATALADIIDNSIAARSDKVALLFSWKEKFSTIRIVDNGEGMDGAELDRAMRLGEKSPLDPRQSQDLGRFGLGLKTASFSQCRRLTVASRKEGQNHCLRWDLDVLANSADDGWHLLEGPASGSEFQLMALGEGTGTLVLWENLDRIVTAGFNEQDFLDLIDQVEQHLAMVFHRYLSGVKPRLQIHINGHPVAPWDPFLVNHPATQSLPVERIATGVEVQCHVLPHKDRLDQRQHDQAAGSNGWTAQQGFYVYRNQRLLVAGSWLGLGRGRRWTKEEAYRLARIRLDIPNSADADWKIDIRKSTARPPMALREKLIHLAEDARERARRVFAHRGQAVKTGKGRGVVHAWIAEHCKDGIRYRIDRKHPAVKAVLEEANTMGPHIRAMLRIIEETVPVQRIWLDTTEARETPLTGFAGESAAEITAILNVLYEDMVLRKGYSPALARERLLETEPFNQHPDLVAALPDIPISQA